MDIFIRVFPSSNELQEQVYFPTISGVCSTLFDSGEKAEAAKYLRLVVAYNPRYKKFLDQCEQDDDIADDLARSRREP